jgi:transcriptional regulator with XRE-family HTH domain
MKPHWTGQQFREIRTELGLSQRDLAARAGVASNTIFRIETGVYSTGFDIIERVAAELGYEIDMIKVEDAAEILKR